MLWFSLAAIAALGAVWLTAPRVAEPKDASAIVAASVICVVVAVIALIPSAMVVPRWPAYMVQAGMGTMVIRLFLTLGAGAVYVRMYDPPHMAFMTTAVVCYLLLLAVETGITWWLVHHHWQPPKAEGTGDSRG